VRKLLGIETAGSMSILFVDKTGTMTKGQFEPHSFISGYLQTYKYYEFFFLFFDFVCLLQPLDQSVIHIIFSIIECV
jgi:magnesium-transporting ATPase (P-type)